MKRYLIIDLYGEMELDITSSNKVQKNEFIIEEGQIRDPISGELFSGTFSIKTLKKKHDDETNERLFDHI